MPGCDASGELDEVGDAVLVEDAGGDGGAIASGAVDGDAAVARDFVHALLELGERQVDAIGEVSCGEFARGADVDDDGGILRGYLVGEHGRADSLGGPDEVLAFGQCSHAIFQIAFDVVEADASEAQGGLLFAAGLGDDDDGAF